MTTDPPTMRAIIQDGYGAPERVLRLDQIQRPSIGTDDVLIRVRATSVNTPDWAAVAGVPHILRLRSGLWRPSLPVRGSDVAGVVAAVGQRVTDLQPGDEVLGSLSAALSEAGPAHSRSTRLRRQPSSSKSPPDSALKTPQHRS